MVTGSAGSIGSEIARQLLHFAPARLVLVDRWENGQFFLERELNRLAANQDVEMCIADARDKERMERLFKRNRPHVVFHAAAYKHVPLMEANPGEAVKNIVLMTRCLANLSAKFGAESFVMISTDKAVNPTSVMGGCKRVAELYVQALAHQSSCRFVTVRFGNVLDSAGSVVPIFRQQIAEGGPVTVTHPDMVRYFMTIPEASQLVIQAGAMGRGGEIFVLDMGDPVRIVDLATDMIRLSGLRAGHDIEIQYVGRRPGEKLYEELHVHGEKHVATSHPKIMVAESEHVGFQQIQTAIEQLANVTEGSKQLVLEQLRRTIPQFQHELLQQTPKRRAA
jgi:FlaA1/EpsC-like NDP-sugar epimerase